MKQKEIYIVTNVYFVGEKVVDDVYKKVKKPRTMKDLRGNTVWLGEDSKEIILPLGTCVQDAEEIAETLMNLDFIHSYTIKIVDSDAEPTYTYKITAEDILAQYNSGSKGNPTKEEISKVFNNEMDSAFDIEEIANYVWCAAHVSRKKKINKWANITIKRRKN